MSAIKILLGVVRPHLWAVPVLVVLGLLSSLAEGIGIGMMIPLLDVFLRGEQEAASGWFVGVIQQYGAGFSKEARLTLLAGTIFGLIVLKSLVGCAYTSLSAWFNGQASHRLRCALFQQLLGVGYAFFARTEHGRLVNILENETWRTGAAAEVVSSAIISACSVIVLGALLLLISWPMMLGVGAAVFLVALLMRLATRRAHRFARAMVEANVFLTERMLEALTSMRIIRLFGREGYERERFASASDRARRAALRVDLITGLAHPLTEVLYAVLFLGALLVAWHSGLGITAVLAFLFLLYRLQPHLRALDHYRVELASLLPAMAAVTGLLDSRDKPFIRSGSQPFHGLERAVTFDNVSFDYDRAANDRPALAGVSCEFRKNEVTAIVGASGAGKSTLISLLCRFYDPVEGQVRVDGVPLPDLDVAAWRSRLAFAGQDIELMGDTVLENIVYGRPDADRSAIITAARQADAHAFIMSLPEGYETRVGQRGLLLSAGQRQRISLARALLRDPEILILDEATNALDSFSESVIQEALERMAGRRTMIIIAHRLSTIRQADHIVVLSDGRVVEQGRPAELVRANGVFTRLWRLQVGTLVDGAALQANQPPSAAC